MLLVRSRNGPRAAPYKLERCGEFAVHEFETNKQMTCARPSSFRSIDLEVARIIFSQPHFPGFLAAYRATASMSPQTGRVLICYSRIRFLSFVDGLP